MSALRLTGSTSGYSEITPPAIAGDQTFTLPGTGGTLDRLNRAGNILQVVNTMTGAYASGTTLMPVDDTIPQNTEGTEFMTLAITPTSASNKLLIIANAYFSVNPAEYITCALFQDSTADSLAVSQISIHANGLGETFSLIHYMTAGTTSSTTFKYRAGPNSAATVRFNGGGARQYGGVMASSITIMEIAA
jgi:hypothetical protein